MPENNMPDNNENEQKKKDDDGLGEMNIAEEVYAITAGNATLDVEGVAAMSGSGRRNSQNSGPEKYHQGSQN